MRHDKILKLAKGYSGRSHSCFKIAKGRVEKGLLYAYRDRKVKKRDFRTLFIQRINAGVREHGITYNQMIFGLNKANILLNRKMLAELCFTEPLSFKSIVDTVTTITPMRQVIRRVDHDVLKSHVQTIIGNPNERLKRPLMKRGSFTNQNIAKDTPTRRTLSRDSDKDFKRKRRVESRENLSNPFKAGRKVKKL